MTAGIEDTQSLHDAATGLLQQAKTGHLHPNLANVGLFHGDLCSISDLGTATVLHAYDRSIPQQALQHMGQLVRTSTTLRTVISTFQLEGSRGLRSRYGMPLRLIQTCPDIELQDGQTGEVHIYAVTTCGERQGSNTSGPSLAAMYQIVNHTSDGLQPPSELGGSNGELTEGPMQTVIRTLEEQCHMGRNSHIS